MKFTSIPLLLFVLLVSCNSTEEADKIEEPVAEAKTCLFHYDHETTLLNWTAFKHSSKAPVGGAFTQFTVEGFEAHEDLTKAIAGIVVKIQTNSAETNDAVRNQKIAESFFGSMNNPGDIEVSFTSTEGSNTQGSIVAEITMNGVSKNVNLEYEVENATDLKLKGTIDVLDWGAEPALNKLNDVCLEQHIGTDGLNKLWSEVSLVIVTKLNKVCE